ncbi:nesprin-2 isoform X2 [Pelodiscus sinensis]|uniref:nesprin-2 isoform X2 n=1 Tax=Pelodiscus sinensis TaxID=13735 RepID=UPI003F6A62FD
MASKKSSPSAEEQSSTEIDDLHVSLQVEQECTQKKTFTSWINSQLAKHTPPSTISDLYADIKEGRVLLDLLEVLSGQQLPREKGCNTFQCRSNIENALTFLKNKSIKLINIHVADVIEGKPSIVLGLIWTIILHFHIEELAQTLGISYYQPSFDCSSIVDLSPAVSPQAKKRGRVKKRWKISAKKALLLWVKEQCSMHGSINVTDFKSSWRNGLAFLAVIHALRPDLVDMDRAKGRANKENLKEAFKIAEHELNIPRLLEPEDVDVINPDEKSIMTYVAQFLQYSRSLPVAEEDMQGKVKEALSWLSLTEKKLSKLSVDTENETYYRKFQEMRSFIASFNEEKRPFLPVLSSNRSVPELNEDRKRMRVAWDNLTSQINEWKTKMDQALPPPLDSIEVWLQEVEHLLAEDLADSQDHCKAMALFKEKIRLFKGLMDNFDCHLITLQSFENKDEKDMPLVPLEKLDDMKRRFSNIQSTNFSILLEYHYCLCAAILDEVTLKLNIRDIRYGTKESVELLLRDWHGFIEERGFTTQLETAFQICEDMRNKNISMNILAGDPQDINKLFKMVDAKISMCREYIYNVNLVLQKILSSWDTYIENIHLLKAWLDETRKEHPKKVPTEILAKWNSVHGSLNEAGNFLIEVSNEQVRSDISKELKKLNARWAKFIKRTKFEMRLLRMQEEQKKSDLDNNGNSQSPAEAVADTLNITGDISTEATKRNIQKAELREKNADVIEQTTELLPRVEIIEELLKGMENWATETECFLETIQHEGCVGSSREESLQILAARRAMCQEQVAAAEEILQVLTRNISSQVSLLDCQTAGLQTRIKDAKDRLQAAMINLDLVSPKSEERLSEKEVMRNFEESQKELETSILKAVQLVSHKVSRDQHILKNEEAFSILDTRILENFLKAAEQLKNISPAHEKVAVEARCRDVRERWEAVHREIISCIQFIMEMEIGKFNASFSKLNKQLSKEKKLLSIGKTKRLIKEHEAFFSPEGCLGELNNSLQVLKAMCKKLTAKETHPETKKLIAECEQKQEQLQKCAADAYRTLLSHVGDGQASEQGGSLYAPDNGEKHISSQSVDILSTQEASGPVSDVIFESDLKQRNGESCAKKFERDSDLPLKNLLESFDTQRSNLELHLQKARDKVDSAFTDEIRDTSCLQNKLLDLQVIERKANSCWTQIEIITSKLENLMDNTRKPSISETRNRLNREWSELQIILNARMKSLKTALEVVLPIEKEFILLCNSDGQLHKIDIQQFTLTNTDFVYRELKKVQSCIINQIELCKQLENPDSSSGDEFNPIDLQAAHEIILTYKKQLEEMNHKMRIRKTALKELEAFLASLQRVTFSIEHATDSSISDKPVVQGSASKEAIQQEVSLMKEEAKRLDEHLQMVDIYLENGECGGKTCCEELIVALSGKANKAFARLSKKELIQENESQETFSTRNNELLKNIQDLHDKMNKIGLKDPSIPAVQQRIKSLTQLEQELGCFAIEMKSIREIANKLLQNDETKGEEADEQCTVTERLWEDTKLSLAECQEQCERALELLKQYQSCKNSLIIMIQKQECVLSQQTSYMGKDNLQRMIAKIEVVKEEFNDHSEDVEKINQICKNLHFQLNKMRSFEESPFQNEADIIVDRWLDINEKTENYCDNLGRALALWDKLINLFSKTDSWANTQLRSIEEHQLTEEEVTELKTSLQVQEQNLEEFDRKVAEIQHLLHNNEPPLEFQVIKSSVENKMELIRKHLLNKTRPSELNSNSTELKGDLDLAKTQIGMTESLLKALFPSDTLEIFTKLEELHQKILQQKHHVKLLQKKTGCLNPEVAELKQQLQCITDLFNTKKQIFQDHFTSRLNYQCEDFNDWFSGAQLSLKDCFDPSETKQILEGKLQKLVSFLTFEGKESDIQEVKSLLHKVESYLPEASVNQLNCWVRDQEAELQRVTSKCQKQEKKLCASLQQLIRLQEDNSGLKEWLTIQEETWLETKNEKIKLESLYQMLIKQREAFDSLSQLANSLRESGFTRDERVSESHHLISRYQELQTRVSEILGVTQTLSMEGQNFEALAQKMSSWIKRLNESVIGLGSLEGELPLEERIHQIKEIIVLKDDGDSKMQNIIALGKILMNMEGATDCAIQQTISDLQNQWECTVDLATEYLSHQEQIQLQRKQYSQSKKDLRLVLTELKKQQQELSPDVQAGLQEKQAQITNYIKLLQKAESLTFLLHELKSQGDYLKDCVEDSCFMEESWLELKHLHESLLSQLQDLPQALEGYGQEYQVFQDTLAVLSSKLNRQCEEFCHFTDTSVEKPAAVQHQLKLQEQAPLSQCEDKLKKILALAESVEENTSSSGQKISKDAVETLQCKHRSLKERLKNVKQTGENSLRDTPDSKHAFADETKTQDKSDKMIERENQVFSDTPTVVEENSRTEELEEGWKMDICQGLNGNVEDQEQQHNLYSEENRLLADSPNSPLKDQSKNIQEQTVQHHKEKSSDGNNQAYRENVQQFQQWLCREEQMLNSFTSEKERPSSKETVPILEGSNVEMAFQKQLLCEAQANAEYIVKEQKVSELKNQAAELDIVLVNEQLRELENLYTELEKQRATALSLRQDISPRSRERSTSNLQTTEDTVSCWDRLLKELEAIKEVKQHHHHLVNDYLGNLSAVQSSMKILSTEKENIKTGPVNHIVLEKIKKIMDSIQKERDVLNKLKTEQDNLSGHLTCIDKELTENQVKQLERWWEHIEQSVQKKHYQVVSEIDEFNLLMNKAQDLQKLIQHQQHLQAELNPEDGQKNKCPLLWTSELQAIKYSVSLLKGSTELQMKRIWSEEEKKTLENSIHDLQNQLEVLAHQIPQEDVWILVSDPKKYEITRRIKDNISWVKDSLFSLDQKAALFPDDITIQIRNCKAVNSEALDKETTLELLADETQSIISDLNPEEVTYLSSLLQELQKSYQAFVLKSAQRLQQLEFQLEKRQRLIAEIQRVHSQLQNAETLTIPDINETSTGSELGNLYGILKDLSKEIQESEDLISSRLQESQHSHGELNIFEQLFLTDQLRCLKNRARKIQRLIQNKCHAVEKKVAIYTELSERITSLNQELNDLWCDILKLEGEEILSVKEEVKDKLNVLQKRIFDVQSSLLQIMKYKEIFDCLRLNWDTSHLDELQTQFLEIKNKLEEKIKCFDNCVIESVRHQALLSEIQTMISNIKHEADMLTNSPGSSSETNFVSAQILCQRVQQVRHLIQEAANQLNLNEVFAISLKKAKAQQIKSLEEDIDGLHQFLQDIILDLQAEYANKQDFQSTLEHTLHTIKQIKSEFQQPLVVDLEMKIIQSEKMHCEAIQDWVQTEFCAIVDLMGKEREKQEPPSCLIADVEAKLDELENLQIQLKTDIASRLNALDEAQEKVKLYTEAVQRASDLLTEYEARILSAKVSLGSLQESCQIPHWKLEEFESAKADIEDLSAKLENVITPRAKQQLKQTLSELVTKNSVLREKAQRRRADVQRYFEKYSNYSKIKEKICANLNKMEKILGQSLSSTPRSYKEALEHLEQSKVLVSQILSAEEDLMTLRRDSRDLSMMCKGDGMLVQFVSTLWGKWLGLLEAAKEWEMNCEDQKQEWKFVNEEVERQSIILDNLQEELPESLKEKEKASTNALLELLDCVDCYKENMDREQLLLLLLLHRIRSILNVPESTERETSVPIRYEIHAMQDRCRKLSQKAQKHKNSIQSEIQERDKINEEINSVRMSLQNTSFLLCDGESQDSTEKAAQLEEVQRIINRENQTIKDIMEKLRIKYSDMYTIVPADIETQLEGCKKTLQDLEEKVTTRIFQNSPHYVINKKVENINNGLQAVEKMLQQKSENIAKAKEIQKAIWDMLDLWHYKLNELDSEVQDIAEQDPCHSQEWMDSLMIPLQQYQLVSQRAELRTTLLNKATSKMEEYDELLKSMQYWIETTNGLLTAKAENNSAKALSKHASVLQMALEDSEQKQNLLHSIYSQLDELSVILETENIVQQINEVNGQVIALQQKIMEILPHIQHMADEVNVIESEVKIIEKDVAKIKTILSTEDILDFSPKEHLRNGLVILDHINRSKKTLAEIQGYEEGLRLPGMRMQPLLVFKRAAKLMKELKMLEKITKEQNVLLESFIKETDECEQEIEKLKQFLKNQLGELSNEKPLFPQTASCPEGEMEDIKEQIIKLCQKKDDILTGMKSSILELHQHLQKKQPEPESELSKPLAPEETSLVGKDTSERQMKKKGSMSLLPSLAEETEDSSFLSEENAIVPPAESFWPSGKRDERDRDDSGASWSSGTLSDGIALDADVLPESCDKHSKETSFQVAQKTGSDEDCAADLNNQAVGDTPSSVTNTGQCFQKKPGESKETVDSNRPEPEKILHVCQAQITELELWLEKAKVSLESETQTPEMQQMVEQQLADCQVMLSELEQKVVSLLEDCRDRQQGDSAVPQQEAEALSLKLKDVKCSLEKVQVLLQDKYSEEQHNCERIPSEVPQPGSSKVSNLITTDTPPLSRCKGLQQRQDLLLKPTEQNNLVDFIKLYVEKMQPHFADGATQKLDSSSDSSIPRSELADLFLRDQTGDKWQYLQQELSATMKSPLCQLADPQITTELNILPRGAICSIKTPTVEELKTYTMKLGDLSQEASVVQTQENVAGEASLNLEKKLFELLLAISQCLNNMEEMLNTCMFSNEEAAVQQVLCETLSLELQKLHADMREKKDDLLKSVACADGSTDVFVQCFNNVQARLELSQTAAASRSKSMKAGLDHSSNYQNEIRLLYDQLIEKKSALQQTLNAIRGHNIAEQLQKTDAYALELQNFETQIAKLRDHGEQFQLPMALVHEVYKLEDVLDDTWGVLRAKYVELNSPFISESQYEGLIHGLAELLDIGQEKVAQDSKELAKNRATLQSHLQNHKDFFQKLVTHMFVIQSYSKKVGPATLQKNEKFWTELVEYVRSLEQKSSQYGARLEGLLQEWTEFDEDYVTFTKELEALASTVPSVNLVEETEERVMERITLLQQIKRNIDEHHARLYQMVKEGKKLMTLVSCSDLVNQTGKLEELWLSLTNKVGHELHRLQMLLKLLVSYNRDSDKLTKWLESAQQRMNFWKEQSLDVSQDLDTVRNNIDSLFAFSKEVDEKSSLKSSVISTGNQLLLVKQTDAAALRSSLAQFEQKWAELITQFPTIQEKLHQLQMEKLPSREAITEIMAWLNHVEQQREEEATVNLRSNASQVKNLLQKYKEYLMEMNFKQWMVDFVNQSLLQISTCDVESKRYERTEFAEHLGEMNLQWHRLQGSLNRKIQDLEHTLEIVTENENKVQTLSSWLKAQGERLKSLEKPASLISVQTTLEDCKELENQLTIKSKAIDQLKQNYMPLEDGAEQTSEDTVVRMDKLLEMRNGIISQVAQLKTSMQSVLQQWLIYDETYEEVNLMIMSSLYCLQQCKPPVISLEALKHQLKILQSIQDKAEGNEESWAKFQASAANLKKCCCSSFAEIIDHKCKEAHTRWTLANEEVNDELQATQALLQLWEHYDGLHSQAVLRLEQHEEQCHLLLGAHLPEDNMAEVLKQKIQDVKILQQGLQPIKGSFLQVSELTDQITQHAKAATQAVLSDKAHPLQRISYLEKMLQMKSDEFKFNLLQLEDFKNCLDTVEAQIKSPVEALDQLHAQGKEDDSELLMSHMLELAAMSPDIENLNEVSVKLPLSDFTVKQLQSLKRQWIQKTTAALEHFRTFEGIESDEKKLLQKCKNWLQSLEKMKEALKVNISGRFEKLQEQQRIYEKLQMEISVNDQIFNSVISKGFYSLGTGEAEKRTEFISTITQLKEEWQGVIRRVQERKKDIDGLVKQWQHFRVSQQNLTNVLTCTSNFIAAVKSQDSYSLYHLRNLIHNLKNKEILLQRWQTTYSLAVNSGEKLLKNTDQETSAVIQDELSRLQENWNDAQLQVEKITKQLLGTAQTWDSCEKRIKELENRLRQLKAKIKDPLPDEDEELHKAKEHIKELEKSLAGWNQNVKELDNMKADLAHYILAEDVMLLKEQVEHLHRQWEELCLRVSLRKQEIEDRLNVWSVFNEKNKELCAWLVQMESKVLQPADVSIEDVLEKLQKDCMEEINLFSENKLHLKQMGDQLIKSSNKSRVAEIDDKLNKINNRWQHLFDVIGGRVKKLEGTFAVIQRLDKTMSNLRTWLARIEAELSKPVVYDICDDQEIQKRLAEQQDLQRDIEQHSEGVESVFNICEALLSDSDACANETECDSIQQTTRSLDRRWRNICSMSMERRMKIEETWRLWQKFLEDYSRFEDWLKSAERTAAYPNSSEVLYTGAKEELKKFEAFQRQIHERLTQLELINKQYRRLARENRTDSASKLKQMVHEGNQRWDNLQKRVAAILRRLKYFTNQRDEFEGTRDSILVWLTEMDLQLTNVEHFSESNFDDKMRQLNGFQQEITLNTNKIDQLIVFGEQLIQKSEPLDAILIEDELEELHRYCQEVFGRVSRFHQRLTSRHPGIEDDKDTSENETDAEDSREIQNDPWHKKAINELPSSQQSLCHLVSPAPAYERSGCETPVSVDSIPLEWDHTGDVGGSSSHEDEEEGTYYSALSGKSISEALTWHSPDSPTCRKHEYNQTEMLRNVQSGSPETSTPYKPGYAKLLVSASSGNMDSVKEASAVLNDEDPQNDQGLVNIAAAEKQSGVIEKWELIQAQDLRNKLRMKQNLQQWQQLNSDLSDITAWLDKTEEELEELQKAKPATSLHAIEQRVKKLKDMLKAFDNYKALVFSVNLSSKDFQQTDSTESKELQNRLRQVNLRWEKVSHSMDNWRKGLKQTLMQCQDFHELSQKLLLGLANAESRRHKAQFTDPNSDPHTILECQKELMQLEKELLEQQLQVNALQEISTYLLVKSDGENYIEADEKIHIIGKKLKQLLEQVSHDLKTSQGNMDKSAFLPAADDLDSGGYHPLIVKSKPQEMVGVRRTSERKSNNSVRLENQQATQASSSPHSFFYRVLRAALPLQFLFLLFLLLACMIPSSEEDYSCTQVNNFARSFYPMLRYTNGPPPT